MRALLAALLIVCVAGPAAARSCAEAQRALASAQAGGGGGREADALRQQAKAFGCGKTSMFGRAPQCAGIEARLGRASGRADGRTIRRLQQEVNRACAAAPVVAAREPKVIRREPRRENAPNGSVIIHGTREDNQLDRRANRGNFFSRLFGAGEDEIVVETARVDPSAPGRTVERHSLDSERPRRDAGPAEIQTLATGGGTKRLREGGYQTMCVRLCDGFYFPINSRSHSDNFYEELAMCVGRCPGADVSLYVHSSGGAAESMRSAMTGEPYVRLPTAFVYRKALVPNCGCEPQTVIAADQTAEKALSYVRDGGTAADGTSAEAAAEAAAADGGWTPLKAVFDETGKPLDLLIGIEQVARPAGGTKVSGTTAGTRASTAATTPVDSSSVVSTAPAAALGGDASDVRTVGGQFFSDSPDALAEVEAPQAPAPTSASGPVTVVPIPADEAEERAGALTPIAPAQTSLVPTTVTTSGG
jgi:hypothetical protein